MEAAEEELQREAQKLPNLTHPQVPLGRSRAPRVFKTPIEKNPIHSAARGAEAARLTHPQVPLAAVMGFRVG